MSRFRVGEWYFEAWRIDEGRRGIGTDTEIQSLSFSSAFIVLTLSCDVFETI